MFFQSLHAALNAMIGCLPLQSMYWLPLFHEAIQSCRQDLIYETDCVCAQIHCNIHINKLFMPLILKQDSHLEERRTHLFDNLRNNCKIECRSRMDSITLYK